LKLLILAKKLIEGQSLLVGEHRKGYLDLAFVAYKGRNWAGGKIQLFKVPMSSSIEIAAMSFSKFE